MHAPPVLNCSNFRFQCGQSSNKFSGGLVIGCVGGGLSSYMNGSVCDGV